MLKDYNIVRVVSVVVLAKISTVIDLIDLSKKIEGSQLAPWNTRLGMRLPPGKIYVTFFKSGKFQICGIRQIDLIDETVEQVLAILRKSGVPTKLESVEIANITLTDKVHLGKSLEHLLLILEDSRAYYEPEQFPGLIYKDEGRLCYLVFNTGKMVITGVKNIDSVKELIEGFKTRISS